LKKFNTISCEELMTEPMQPLRFFVDGLITSGLYILAGYPKVGKSWLALDICLSVATGREVLSAQTIKGTALYLCLEDSKARMQNRLYELTDEPADDLHFVLMADKIGSGIEEQIENFVMKHKDTCVVFIDTLQKIRCASQDNAYAADYNDLSSLKAVADKLGIAVVLVHHLRKTKDADPFNMISGTTGISGCVDGSFVLIKSSRTEHKATLHCTGRDIEDKEIGLEFRNKRWTVTDEVEPKDPDIFSFAVHDLMMELKMFRGTATEMCALMKNKYGTEVFPNRLTRDLVQHTYEMRSYGVEFSHNRSNGQRIMTLTYRQESDGSDGKILMRGDLNSTDPTVPVISVESPQTLSQIEITAVTVNNMQSKVTDPATKVTVPVGEVTDPVIVSADPVERESAGDIFIRMVAERSRNNLLARGIFVKPFSSGR